MDLREIESQLDWLDNKDRLQEASPMLDTLVKLSSLIVAAICAGVAATSPVWISSPDNTAFLPLRGVFVGLAVFFAGVLVIDHS